MTAKWIKTNPNGLEGAVLAYVKEPNSHGFHDAVLSTTSAHSFLKLYLMLKGVQSDGLLRFLDDLQGADQSSDQEIISVRTAMEDINDIAEKYDCDIIEIHIPKPEAISCMPVSMLKNLQDIYEAECMNELDIALNDYFDAYWKKCLAEPDPYPTYADCTRDEWMSLFSELHENLLDPSIDTNYDAIEKDLQQLCKDSGVPAKLVSDMCEIAKNGFSEKAKVLCYYKELIFAVEEKRYEDAADLKSKIIKLQKE